MTYISNKCSLSLPSIHVYPPRLLRYYRAEIDMAFMVLLNLNIEDAVAANATTAEQVTTY